MEGWLFTLVEVNSPHTLTASSQLLQSNEICHKMCHLTSHKLQDRDKSIPYQVIALL